MSGGLQPRINVFFADDRGVTTTSLLWGNMIDDPAVTTSRDAGVPLDGAQGRRVRDAALASVAAMPRHTSIRDLVRRGDLPESI